MSRTLDVLDLSSHRTTDCPEAEGQRLLRDNAYLRALVVALEDRMVANHDAMGTWWVPGRVRKADCRRW